MKRRTFLKSGSAGTFILLTPTSFVKIFSNKSSAQASLEDVFLNPPDTAKAKTWWHWMNGNVTKVGITLDMEAMKQAGVGGFQIFDVGAGIVPGPVHYHSPEWVEMKEHAVKEAERLGLAFEMHNCPGWSSSGAPWIPPELSMQYLVWSEAYVTGGKTINTSLPQPNTKHGYYRDAMVLAFPSLQGEEQGMEARIVNAVSNDGAVDKTLVTNCDLNTGVDINKPQAGESAFLSLEFSQPVESRSLILYSAALGAESFDRFNAPSVMAGLEISDDGKTYKKIADISLGGGSRRGGIESPTLVDYTPVSAKYYRLSSAGSGFRVKYLQLNNGRIANWDRKSGMSQNRGGFGGQEQTAEPMIEIPAGSVIDPETVIDLTGQMDDQGQLTWDAPQGSWTIIRFGHTPTGVTNNAAPTDGEGLEVDKFSRTAFDFHFEKMFGELVPSFKQLAEKGMVGALIDSYEVGAQNWTVEFPQQFMQYRNYDLVKYMPAMTGRVVGSPETSERFLYDIRKTCADSIADNYFGYFSEVCNQHGIISYTEPYGGPFDQMQVGSMVDVPMGEYWIRRGMNDSRSVKLAASIAHVTNNGNQIAGAEAFTGEAISSKWQECPYMMKAQGDAMYTAGLNQFIFHRYAHQPHPTAAPGMTMGPFGFHFDRTNTWFPKATGWLGYAARCQNMLRNGMFVADVAYFVGEERPVGTPDRSSMSIEIPEGYDYDTLDAKTILDQMDVSGGRIVLSNGMSYRLLVLSGEATMSAELLEKIGILIQRGATVVGPRPMSSPSLEDYLEGSDAKIKSLADSIWGNIDGVRVTENTYGQGKVIWGKDAADIFDDLELKPDFEYSSAGPDPSIRYIHRNMDGNDFYFVTNARRRAEDLVCTFRVNGKMPELWDAVSGRMTPAPVYELTDGRVRMPLRLDYTDSVFVVFRSQASGRQVNAIVKGSDVIAGTDLLPKQERGRYGDLADTFTVTLWAKPEIETTLGASQGFRGSSNYAIYPPQGESYYGPDHVTMGLEVGRNGVVVYERGRGNAMPVLTAEEPLAGWTHLAVAYRNGIPSLYVNGTLVKSGQKSGSKVHPAINEAYMDEGASYFEGDTAKIELHDSALSESRIKELSAAGIPEPEDMPVAELIGGSADMAGVVFWQEGSFTLRDSSGNSQTVEVSGIGEPVEITSPWKVSFPAGLGAPSEITMDELASLHRQSDEGVKYFSGTATYGNSFRVQAGSTGNGKRLFLDLGRVEVLAEVKVNGKDIGLFWKPPYRIDITDAVQTGENQLEVMVTNLWPNRLIGDERIPCDYEYGGSGMQVFSNSDDCIREIPEWYLNSGKQPGQRVTFSVWHHFREDDPLLESGLIGPVKLRTAFAHDLEI